MEKNEKNENIKYGTEFLKLRKLLKISQKDFARISLMTQEELQDFENNKSDNLFSKRLKICIALERLLKYKHENFPEIVVNEIISTLQSINPFDTIDDFVELSMLIQTLNQNIDEFKENHFKK